MRRFESVQWDLDLVSMSIFLDTGARYPDISRGCPIKSDGANARPHSHVRHKVLPTISKEREMSVLAKKKRVPLVTAVLDHSVWDETDLLVPTRAKETRWSFNSYQVRVKSLFKEVYSVLIHHKLSKDVLRGPIFEYIISNPFEQLQMNQHTLVVPFLSQDMKDRRFFSVCLDDYPWTQSPAVLLKSVDSTEPVDSLALEIVHFFPPNPEGDFFLAQLPIQYFLGRCSVCQEITYRRCPKCLLPWCSTAHHRPFPSSPSCSNRWCAQRSSLSTNFFPLPATYVQETAPSLVTDGGPHFYVKEYDPDSKLIHCDPDKQYLIKQRKVHPKPLIFKTRRTTEGKLDLFIHGAYTSDRGVLSTPIWSRWFSIPLADLVVSTAKPQYVLGSL